MRVLLYQYCVGHSTQTIPTFTRGPTDEVRRRRRVWEFDLSRKRLLPGGAGRVATMGLFHAPSSVLPDGLVPGLQYTPYAGGAGAILG